MEKLQPSHPQESPHRRREASHHRRERVSPRKEIKWLLLERYFPIMTFSFELIKINGILGRKERRKQKLSYRKESHESASSKLAARPGVRVHSCR